MMPSKMAYLSKFDSKNVWPIPQKNSPKEAAELLLLVKKIAVEELKSCRADTDISISRVEKQTEKRSVHSLPPAKFSFRDSSQADDYPIQPRMAFTTNPMTPQVVTPPLTPASPKVQPEPIACEEVQILKPVLQTRKVSLLGRPSKSLDRWKVVNINRDGKTPIRAIIQPKFSWKTYPELENYLIEHRAKYLQFSSEKNYTRDQKRYNNRLTQGLIALATESGYVFEGFSFPAIRDRIR